MRRNDSLCARFGPSAAVHATRTRPALDVRCASTRVIADAVLVTPSPTTFLAAATTRSLDDDSFPRASHDYLPRGTASSPTCACPTRTAREPTRSFIRHPRDPFTVTVNSTTNRWSE
ncbi:hypothetical protein C8R45DRAFT_1095154 [Mycena sanguinolenta]|nr:hypothetical protein C8R45DRAFT_1095154 [Mycena sanguinolenta]